MEDTGRHNDLIREQFGVNQWMEQTKVITSLDLAKRTQMLPGLRQAHWDLVIVDEAHRMSWTPPLAACSALVASSSRLLPNTTIGTPS